MGSIDWLEILNPLNAEEAWNLFLDKFKQFINRTIPKSSSSHNKKNPYINSKAMKLRRAKHGHWTDFCITGSLTDYCRYTQTQNALHRLRSNYESNVMLSVKSNPKIFWKYISSKLKIKNLLPPLVSDNGQKAISDSDKAKLLSSSFQQCIYK